MNITKDQSKQLRYVCGLVAYNQPCTRKYTGTPEGKVREIGKFKYIENGSELKSFTYDGGAVNLEGITFDVLLGRIWEGDGLGPIPESEKPSDIEDAVETALAFAEPDVVVHVDVAPGNDVHAVNVPVTVEAADDGWCTPENVGDWQEPDEMERVLKESEERRKRMNITKDQSKQLRYACGLVAYNQPCTRKYTGTPEGKLREIGKFKYIENGGELKSFTYNGGAVNLEGITFDVLLGRIWEGDGLGPIPESEKPSDIEDAVETAPAVAEPDVVVHVDVASGNDVHAVNVPVTVEAATDDGWCTPENVGDWQEPDEMERVLKESEERRKLEGDAEKGASPAEPAGSRVIKEPTEAGYVEPELPDMTPTNKGEVDANGLPLPPHRHPEVTREEYENALREVAMNTAAREALRILNLECGFEDAATILRAMAKVPNFIATYGKCLEQVGTPLTIAEIAAALPNQQGWLATLALNDWKIKE